MIRATRLQAAAANGEVLVLLAVWVATHEPKLGPLHLQAHQAGHPSRSLRKFKITPGIGECKEDLFGFCGFVPIALLSINSFYMVPTSSDINNIRAK